MAMEVESVADAACAWPAKGDAEASMGVTLASGPWRSGGRVEQVLEDARIATAGGSTSAGRPHERASAISRA